MIFNILIVLSVFYNQHLTNFIIINKSYVSFSVGCVRCRVSRTTGPRGWGGRLGGAGAEGASGADTATLARERPPAPRSASWNLGGRHPAGGSASQGSSPCSWRSRCRPAAATRRPGGPGGPGSGCAGVGAREIARGSRSGRLRLASCEVPGALDDGRVPIALPRSAPWPGLQKGLRARGGLARAGPAGRRCPAHSRLPPRACSSSVSLAEVWDQRAIGRYHELFAASLGNLEWLRFCLNRHRGEIPADDKVRPRSSGAGTEIVSTPQRAPYVVVTWRRVTVEHPEMSFSGEMVLIHLPTVWKAIWGSGEG